MAKRGTKYIFITGGVLSGVGKGITASSIGQILHARGFKVNAMKCDPYLNIDAGTLNPAEHGETYVTEDGAECDLDVGHYERFLNTNLTKNSSVMTGAIYRNVLAAERAGEYLGQTVQMIPHLTREIQKIITEAAKGYDIQLVEIGGTIGDYEALHFFEAIRQMKRIVGAENVLYVQVVYLPYLEISQEIKTRPAQSAVKDLRSIGIQPDILAVRSERPASADIAEKLSLFTDVPVEAIFMLPTARSVYEVPLNLERQGAGRIITRRLGLPKRIPKQRAFKELVKRIKAKKPPIKVALVAKYMKNADAYLSVLEAVRAASWANNLEPELTWVSAEQLEKDGTAPLAEFDGIIVPGGFGHRGIEGKIQAARYAREKDVPYLGLCLGMQIAVIEFARNVARLAGASSTEFDQKTKHPVIDLMNDQKRIVEKGGTMRLGNYDCMITKGTLTHSLYKQENVKERHRHRYEFNNKYRGRFEMLGMKVAGVNPQSNLVEIVEIPGHPFFIGSQFHPELTSRPLRPHPLFLGFIEAAKKRRYGKKK